MTSLPFEDLPAEPVQDFDHFWSAYPRKCGKLAALKAYYKALKTASHADIMTGLRHYLTSKPSYADWAHPTTWLNQGRWMDEPDSKPKPDDDAIWRDKAARMIKLPEYKQPRQDVEEAFRRGLLTDAERDEAL